MARKPIKLLAIVSDLHCGSKYALCPPAVELDEGETYRANKVQGWYWDQWKDATESWLPAVVGDDPFAFAVNGDIIEGHHHGGRDLISPDALHHCRVAEAALAPVSELADRLFMVVGTECHVGMWEDRLGKTLGAELDPDTGASASQHWLLNFGGCIVSIRHHIGASGRIGLYATQLSVALTEEQAQAVRHGGNPPHVVVRAHRHTHGSYTDGKALCVTTGAWQATTRHVHKVVPAARPCASIIVLDWRHAPAGGLPVVHERIYTLPAREPVTPEAVA